jgi:hypothetical protein
MYGSTRAIGFMAHAMGGELLVAMHTVLGASRSAQPHVQIDWTVALCCVGWHSPTLQYDHCTAQA